MAQLKISGNVTVGGIYECDFGAYRSVGNGVTHSRDNAVDSDMNYRIPNEMIKRRPVIVISKHRGLCTVVPVSATREKVNRNPRKDLVHQGICVSLQGYVPETHFYDGRDNWGVCYAAQTIDSGRLRDIYDRTTGSFKKSVVPPELLLKLRFGVVKAIGLPSLVPEEEEQRIAQALTPAVEGVEAEGD